MEKQGFNSNGDIQSIFWVLDTLKGIYSELVLNIRNEIQKKFPGALIYWAKIWWKTSNPEIWGFQLIETPEPFKITRKWGWYTFEDGEGGYGMQRNHQLAKDFPATIIDLPTEIRDECLCDLLLEQQNRSKTDGIAGTVGKESRFGDRMVASKDEGRCEEMVREVLPDVQRGNSGKVARPGVGKTSSLLTKRSPGGTNSRNY